jgi:hypothetical protein
MHLALTNALISDLIAGRPLWNLYYLAMVLDWTGSRGWPLFDFRPCQVHVLQLLGVFDKHAGLDLSAPVYFEET